MTRVRFGIGIALLASQALGAPDSSWLASPPGLAPESSAAPHEEAPDEARGLREELQELKKEAAEREAFVVARGRAYVRLARAGLLPLSEGLEAFAAYTSRLERLRRALGRDLEREKQITAREIELSRALKSLEELPPVERSAMARARAAILAAEERDQAFQRAFQSDATRLPSTAVYAAHISVRDRARSAGGFAAQRGRLPFPLAGRSEIQTIPSPSGTGKALLLSASWGAPVRAVFAGRVAFADEYPNLGNTVILDHGGRYYTLSAHLQHISVRVGEELDAGQRIGSVGSDADKPTLLFEVRDGQNTLNTPEWFGL
jgi:septal ring factor EnvC (AmiA/AmiB activator)